MRFLPAFLATCLIAGCARTLPAPAARTDAPEADRPEDKVSYSSGKDTVQGVLRRPAGTGPFPAVVVVHDDFGLTDGTKAHAQRLAEKGYVALAVDLYRGEKADDLMEAHILGRALPDDRVLGDLRAAVDFLTSRPDVKADAVGVIGFGMGGGYALDAALADPRLRAVVVCYGRLTTDPAALARLNGSVFGVFAGRDEGITPQTIEQFLAAMDRAGKRWAGLHVYPQAGHSFLEPVSHSKPAPGEADAAADALARIEAYLAGELGGHGPGPGPQAQP